MGNIETIDSVCTNTKGRGIYYWGAESTRYFVNDTTGWIGGGKPHTDNPYGAISTRDTDAATSPVFGIPSAESVIVELP